MPNTTIRRQPRALLQKLITAARKDLFLTIALLAAILTSFFGLPRAEYIDFKVILCLFELMVIVKAFEEYALLQAIAVGILRRCGDERLLTQALCLITFVFAMFVTNDVALLTMIPILIVISRKSSYNMTLPAVFVTVAANLGSSLTPIGNPQNLFLYSHYDMTLGGFLSQALPLGGAGLALVLAMGFFVRPAQIQVVVVEGALRRGWRLPAFGVLGLAAVLSVVGALPWLPTFFVVAAATAVMNPRILLRADYKLLLTFVCIFIAIGNITNWPALKGWLAALTGTPAATYGTALLTSQLISNVPATILLAPFASSGLALFHGVNIGGLGTPIASLASVITYRLFASEYPDKRQAFLGAFSLYNFGCLLLLGAVFFVILAV